MSPPAPLFRSAGRRPGRVGRPFHPLFTKPVKAALAERSAESLRRSSALCRGVTFIELLVYVSVLLVVLAVAGNALYQGMKQSAALRRNAEDIATALRAGERWRTDVRAATGPIRVTSEADGQTVRIPTAETEVVYAFRDSAIWRGSDLSVPQKPLVPRAAASRVMMDDPSSARWELELQSRSESAKVRPLFTFQAASARSPRP